MASLAFYIAKYSRMSFGYSGAKLTLNFQQNGVKF